MPRSFLLEGSFKFFFFGIFALFAAPALAQVEGCDADIAKFCASETGMKERFECLLKRVDAKKGTNSASDGKPEPDRISLVCQQGLQRFAAELKARGSRGGSGVGGSGSAAGGNGLFPPSRPLLNLDSFAAAGGSGYTQNKLSLASPVYGEKTQMLAMSVGVGDTHFQGSQALSGTTQDVPRDLQRYEVGAQYQRFM